MNRKGREFGYITSHVDIVSKTYIHKCISYVKIHIYALKGIVPSGLLAVVNSTRRFMTDLSRVEKNWLCSSVSCKTHEQHTAGIVGLMVI